MNKITNKLRILKVKEIFFENTDIDNQLSIADIINKLNKDEDLQYKVSSKAIKDDIKTLRDYGMSIYSSKNKYGKKMYSYQDRLFETNELRVLIDSISSSGSIELKDKKRIINNIKELTSENIAQKLSKQIPTDNRIINKDKTFRYTVDKIYESIQNRNKIEFKYGRYDINKTFIVNEKTYRTNPYDLVWENGFYYLVAYDEAKEKIINFRIDRMRKVEMLEESYPRDFTFNLSEHLESCFNMYPGDVRMVGIEFDKHLINAIIDKFGVNIVISKIDKSTFTLYRKAAINKGLVRWILNWGSDARVISPPSLIEEVKLETIKMYKIYNGK